MAVTAPRQNLPETWVTLFHQEVGGQSVTYVSGPDTLASGLVSFMHHDLGYIDLEERTLQPLENPFRPKVLPMS